MVKQNFIKKAVAKTAMAAAKKNVNSACTMFWHQPQLPEAAKKLRKF